MSEIRIQTSYHEKCAFYTFCRGLQEIGPSRVTLLDCQFVAHSRQPLSCMAPKKESAAAAKRGKPSAPDYLGIENYAVCKAALAAAVVPNQTVKANDSQVGLQERTCERYPMQLDAAVEKFGWPKQSVGRGSTTKDWTVELIAWQPRVEVRPAHAQTFC